MPCAGVITSPTAETACSSRLTCAEVPRGDTAGAMMTLTDVRVTVEDRNLLVEPTASSRARRWVWWARTGAASPPSSAACRDSDRTTRASSVAQRADVGYLEQTAVSDSKLTVAEEARNRMTHVKAAQDMMRAAEEAMADGDANATAMLVAANDAFEAVGNTVERRIADVLTGLGFAKEAWDRRAALSGGWQMRVALAGLLPRPPGTAEAGHHRRLPPPGRAHEPPRRRRRSGSPGGSGPTRDAPRVPRRGSARTRAWTGWWRCEVEAARVQRLPAGTPPRGAQAASGGGREAVSKEAAKAAKLEQFVAKNSARASTAKAAKSKAKQLQGVPKTWRSWRS